jgi:soluble P-type ATPase
MHFSIPGRQPMEIKTVILDLNGTLTIDGMMIDGVKERIEKLRSEALRLFLFSGDTQGTGAAIARDLGLEFRLTPDANAKAAEAKTLEPETAATIGNGAIDLELFKTVRLRILTLQAEGVSPQTLLESDIVVPSVNDALDLFLKPKRLIATLRT